MIFYLKERNPGNLEELNKVLAFYVEKHNKEINREIGCSPEERFKNYIDVFKSIMEEKLKRIEEMFLDKVERKVTKVNEISLVLCFPR